MKTFVNQEFITFHKQTGINLLSNPFKLPKIKLLMLIFVHFSNELYKLFPLVQKGPNIFDGKTMV
ncbi:MAG: hypothetical protein DWQ02_27425 [Bacteroidetes bacterium]|nr:MAG: hypothetical protein DWQ02_27425 [Bacteroidota bacterium]